MLFVPPTEIGTQGLVEPLSTYDIYVYQNSGDCLSSPFSYLGRRGLGELMGSRR